MMNVVDHGPPQELKDVGEAGEGLLEDIGIVVVGLEQGDQHGQNVLKVHIKVRLQVSCHLDQQAETIYIIYQYVLIS